MTAREYAIANLRGVDNLGVDGYSVRKTLELDMPRNSVILPYKKKTFIDDAIRDKKFVPCANYDVISNLKDKNTRSALPKGKRHTIATDAEALAKRSPQPDVGTYKPNFGLTEKRNIGAFNLKGKLFDTGSLADACFKGTQAPNFYNSNYKQVEPRVTTRKYSKPINVKLDAVPTFLRAGQKKATDKISPASHNPLDSFKKT